MKRQVVRTAWELGCRIQQKIEALNHAWTHRRNWMSCNNSGHFFSFPSAGIGYFCGFTVLSFLTWPTAIHFFGGIHDPPFAPLNNFWANLFKEACRFELTKCECTVQYSYSNRFFVFEWFTLFSEGLHSHRVWSVTDNCYDQTPYKGQILFRWGMPPLRILLIFVLVNHCTVPWFKGFNFNYFCVYFYLFKTL